MVGRKADPTGRSGGDKLSSREKKFTQLAPGWLPMPRILLLSPAWQGLSEPARRIVDFLMIEQATHGKGQNGLLLAPHQQLRQFRITGRCIKPAFDMLSAFGIVKLSVAGRRLGGAGGSARYRLTWLHEQDIQGRAIAAPTNDFCDVTQEYVDNYLREAKRQRSIVAARKSLKVVAGSDVAGAA